MVAGGRNEIIRTARTDPCSIQFSVHEMCNVADPITLVASQHRLWRKVSWRLRGRQGTVQGSVEPTSRRLSA
jgi:hypothetical protein